MEDRFSFISATVSRCLFSALMLLALSMSLSCSKAKDKVMSRFCSTLNIDEKCTVNKNGSITYTAKPWGGLVGSFMTKDGSDDPLPYESMFSEEYDPSDLSAYESITFDFATPTPVATQIVVDNRFMTYGKKGITSLTCHFDGQDVTSVYAIYFQASEACTLTIDKIRLNPAVGTWDRKQIWSGDCRFGNWENGFVIPAEEFMQAKEGDKLEFVYNADTSKSEVTYWLIKTIYCDTENTLEGNDDELNDWGCATISGHVSSYRICLTKGDIENLREKGLYVNGFYVNVTKVNLVSRDDNNGKTD